MVQIVDFGSHHRIGGRNLLGRRHQLRTHGAGKGYHNPHMYRMIDRPNPFLDFFINSLSRTGGIVKPQDKRCKFMAAGCAVEGQPRICAVGQKYPDTWRLLSVGSFLNFYGNFFGQFRHPFHISAKLPGYRLCIQI